MDRLFAVLLLLLMTSSLGACNSAGDSAASAGLYVTLLPGANGASAEQVAVKIVDDEGQPVTDVTVSLEGNMTHAGMVPVFTESVWDGADGVEDGVYTVPFTFTMLGDWIITVKIEQRDGELLSQDVAVTVTNEAVTVE